MRKAIISLIILLTPAWAAAQDPAPAAAKPAAKPSARTQAAAPATSGVPAIRDDAPDRYIVVEGDTLWSISGRFLQNPWQWPEIWKMNQDQIRNPNRIYPGDVIVLDRTSQDAKLRIVKLETIKLQPQIRAESLAAKPVPTIPPAVIEPFLAKPLVVGQAELDEAPRVTAAQESRVTLGAGSIAYASGLAQDKGVNWQLFRRGDPLVDPDTREVLGYEAVYLGEARVLKFGEQSTIEITKSVQEVYVDDRLLPAGREVANFGYVPHAPQQALRGRIVSTYGALGEAGPLSIVTLSKGSKDGLQVGHVLAIYRSQSASAAYEVRTSPLYGRQGLSGNNKPIPYYSEQFTPRDGPVYGTTAVITEEEISKLPDERYGLVMVFRTFDRASFGIIMQASRPVSVNDLIANP